MQKTMKKTQRTLVMSDIAPNKIIENLNYACSSVKAAKDKLKHCEKQLEKELIFGADVADDYKLTLLYAKKEALIAELATAYEKRANARVELNELFASLRG